MATNHKLLLEKTEEYLNNNYKFRFNVVLGKIEYAKKESDQWRIMSQPNSIIVEIIRAENYNSKTYIDLLLGDFSPDCDEEVDNHFVKRYDPFKEYFESLPKWDGKDYIKELCDYIILNDKSDAEKGRLYNMLRKFFIRCILCSMGKQVNKNAIIFGGGQNLGKTTFFRWLTPKKLERYITENIERDKDGKIALCQNFMVNLDEIDKMNGKDIASFKSMLSTDMVNLRLPYAASTTLMQRRVNFIGSLNGKEFLNDETGNVRWVIFDVEKLVFDEHDATKPNYMNVGIDNIWAQAYDAVLNGETGKLTKDEIAENEKVADNHVIQTDEIMCVKMFFSPAEPFEQGAIFLPPLKLRDKAEALTGNKFNCRQFKKALEHQGIKLVHQWFNKLKNKRDGYWVFVNENGGDIPLNDEELPF